MIPDGWKECTIREVAKVVRGASPRPAGSPLYFNGSHLPWITVSEVTGDSSMYIDSTKTSLTEEGAKFTRIIDPGTLILSNSGATLGVPKITRIRAGANDGIAMLLDLKEATKEFLYFFLQSQTLELREVIAPGNGQPNLNTELIGGIRLLLPPIKDQKLIAKVLVTWDKAISTTESLIAAKQHRKQALMQQLLTGKKRLPGFKKPWQSIPFGEMYERVTRFVEMDDSTSYVQAIVKRWRAGIDVRNALDGDEIKTKNLQTIHAGDFVLSDIQAAYGAMCKVGPEHDGLYVSNLYTILRPIKGQGCVDYLDQFARTKHMLSLIEQSSNGVKAERLRINFQSKQLMQHEIPVPPDVKEQMAIAKVLMTADREISLLEAKRSALEMQKKALMAVLLTGKKRLKA